MFVWVLRLDKLRSEDLRLNNYFTILCIQFTILVYQILTKHYTKQLIGQTLNMQRLLALQIGRLINQTNKLVSSQLREI